MEWTRLIFLMVLGFHSFADAQSGTTTSHPIGATLLREDLKAMMSIMLVAFLPALIFMAFFSFCLRHCSSSHSNNHNPTAAAADLSRNRQVIDKCPILVYSTVKDLKIGKATLECAVCLNEFQPYDKIRLLPKCCHVFHQDCVDVWLMSHMNCPVCRSNLTSDVADIAINIVAATTSHESESGRELTEQQQQQEHTNNIVTVSGNHESGGVITSSRESRMLEKFPFPRSHSTGHSLAEKVVERYTLRLPENVTKQILENHDDAVLQRAWSSRVCYRSNETTCWTPLRMQFYTM